jgi:hypothetical protein
MDNKQASANFLISGWQGNPPNSDVKFFNFEADSMGRVSKEFQDIIKDAQQNSKILTITVETD